jgi:hypothetical protein
MNQYQTQDKTTLSFAEYKKALEDYLQECDTLCDTEFAKYMAEYEDILEEYYQDGLSVVGMGSAIQYNM